MKCGVYQKVFLSDARVDFWFCKLGDDFESCYLEHTMSTTKPFWKIHHSCEYPCPSFDVVPVKGLFVNMFFCGRDFEHN